MASKPPPLPYSVTWPCVDDGRHVASFPYSHHPSISVYTQPTPRRGSHAHPHSVRLGRVCTWMSPRYSPYVRDTSISVRACGYVPCGLYVVRISSFVCNMGRKLCGNRALGPTYCTWSSSSSSCCCCCCCCTTTANKSTLVTHAHVPSCVREPRPSPHYHQVCACGSRNGGEGVRGCGCLWV